MRTISQQQPLCHHATGSPSATKTHNQQKGTSQWWHTGENSTTKQLRGQNQAGTTYTYISVETCDTQQEGCTNQSMETLHKNSHEKPPLQTETTPVYTRGVHNTQTLTGTVCGQTGIQTRCTPSVHTYRAQAQTHAPPAAPVCPSLVQQLSTDTRAHPRSAAHERAAAGKGEARERARRTRAHARLCARSPAGGWGSGRRKRKRRRKKGKSRARLHPPGGLAGVSAAAVGWRLGRQVRAARRGGRRCGPGREAPRGPGSGAKTAAPGPACTDTSPGPGTGSQPVAPHAHKRVMSPPCTPGNANTAGHIPARKPMREMKIASFQPVFTWDSVGRHTPAAPARWKTSPAAAARSCRRCSAHACSKTRPAGAGTAACPAAPAVPGAVPYSSSGLPAKSPGFDNALTEMHTAKYVLCYMKKNHSTKSFIDFLSRQN